LENEIVVLSASTFGVFATLVVIFILIFLWFTFRNWLTNFIYHMEDFTTGFLKVRERVATATSKALWDLSKNQPIDVHGDYSLEIGKTSNVLIDGVLQVPSKYRSTHMYIVGASGSGKTSLLKNFLVQDVENGIGFCVIDPHGDLINDLIPSLKKRTEQTLVLDLSDTDHMLAYNVLERREGVLVAEQVAKLILAFKRIWEDSWGARMEDILRHTLTLLVEQGYTLAEFDKVLIDSDFRRLLVERSDIDQTKEYFLGRYNTWNPKERSMFIESSLNKISAFMADRRIGARLSQPESSFNIKEIMDSGGILLVNLAKGRLAGNADLFGALLMADIEMSFLTRTGERRPFALYVDEFQNIATESFDTVLAEARKFGLCLTMAHQSLKQLDDKLLSLILGNAQTQIYFRVARQDAERLSKESENMVENLQARDDHLLQEPENKFTLMELWEVAFHKLSRLEFRNAFVFIKGVMEHPELIRTLDNPLHGDTYFHYSDDYASIETLEETYKTRKKKTDVEILKYTMRDRTQDKEEVETPEDLKFLEKPDTEKNGEDIVP